MTPPLVVKSVNGRLWYVDVTPGKPDRLITPYPFSQAPAGAGVPGGPGPSAYELAVRNGFVGSEVQWLASLRVNGKSAYEIAVEAGFVGTLQQWLDSLKGSTTGGAAGKSAFEIAQLNGFTGTQTEWLASLKSVTPGPPSTTPGPGGPDAYQVAVTAGFSGTRQQWLDSLKSTVPGANGPSAYQLAVTGGFVGTQQQWLDSLKSTVPGANGKTAYEVAVAAGFAGTQAQWLASLQGPTAPALIPGLLAAATSLPKGNVVFWNAALLEWSALTPQSHERAVTSPVGLVDRNGNVIAKGFDVDVTGLGYVAGSSYYVESRDASGNNYAVVPLPLPPPLQPSLGRSFFSIGTAYASGGGVHVLFDFQASILDGATASIFKRLDLTRLTYNATPTAQQFRRVLDTEGYGASLNGLRADGDADTQSGFPASPVRMSVNGTLKGVFLQDKGYNGTHLVTPADWTPLQSGDFLLTFAAADANQAGPGLAYGASASSFRTVRVYGAADYIAYQKATVSGTAVTYTDYLTGHAVTGGNRTLLNLRVNLSGPTIKIKFWPYDPSKSLVNQAQSEPATWTDTYTDAAALPSGYVTYLFGNDAIRVYHLSRSSNPAVPAQFDGDS